MASTCHYHALKSFKILSVTKCVVALADCTSLDCNGKYDKSALDAYVGTVYSTLNSTLNSALNSALYSTEVIDAVHSLRLADTVTLAHCPSLDCNGENDRSA